MTTAIAPPLGAEIFPKLVLPLLVVDLLFLLVYVVGMGLDWFGIVAMPARLNIARDGSLPEIWLYMKWLALCLALAAAWMRSGIALYAAFAFVFFVVLCDDALQLHDGKAIGPVIDFFGLSDAAGLRARDLAELAIWSVLGAAILGAIVLGLRRTPPEHRVFAPWLLAGFAALVILGVGVDMLHVVLVDAQGGFLRGIAELGFTLLEDGGEMIVGSVLVGYGAAALVSAPNIVSRAAYPGPGE